MDIRPLHDRVLVRRIDEGESMVGSILIPDSAKEKPQQAEVVAVGEGRRLPGGERCAIDVKPGDRILFGKYAGSETRAGSDEYLILREDEILAVLA
jgi:chaperonin GroES